ncbi:MAG: hypothetical protein ACFCGT_12130 [Sandaracinaceae bacterium]
MAAIELAPGAEDNGLALMLATLISQNVADHPERARDLEGLRGRVVIVAADAGVALTLEGGRRRLRVHDGVVGLPDLTIRADADVITDLSRMEAGPLGLPDPRGEVTRSIARAVREGRLRIHGLPLALPLLARLGHLLAIG